MSNMRHTFYDDVHLIIHILQFVSDTRYFVYDIRYFDINGMRQTQDLCRRHQRLLLGQSVQPLQRVFEIHPAHKLLEELF
jgi:hypothetical protein